MTRITQKHLTPMVDRLNRATSSPSKPYTRREDGTYAANVGNYHLSGAYGGWCLHRMVSDGGAVDDVFRCGHVPARDLYNRLGAFLDGIALTGGAK